MKALDAGIALEQKASKQLQTPTALLTFYVYVTLDISKECNLASLSWGIETIISYVSITYPKTDTILVG